MVLSQRLLGVMHSSILCICEQESGARENAHVLLGGGETFQVIMNAEIGLDISSEREM
ncbi:MAG: hypothetical protein OIF58_01545 [Cohaesibacter sp.]|nr:hypothetical protein [Cohaesibacter sp.]